jgi:outer membrane receptor protein involved in Fe transport
LGVSPARAQQQLAIGDRAPRFLTFVDGGVQPLDVRSSAVLNRRLALDLDGVTVKEALHGIVAQSGLRLVYQDALLPPDARVHLRATEITVAAALVAALMDAGVDVAFDRGGGAVIVRRRADGQPPTGSVAGRVTDGKTGAVLAGATVLLEGTRHTASTGTDGRYRITEVAPGTYTVRARYIGYAPATISVTVTADQEAAADLALERSAQRLDEVVTTGTVVPTEAKALPTPVSVITAADIGAQHFARVDQAFRQSVPSALAWDESTDPEAMLLSVRGAASVDPGGGIVKIYLDGVEVSSRVFNAIDPNSIDRIEVVRGPQAATIYGSEAIGGVMQVFTKRGDVHLSRPQVELQAALGSVESPYGDFGGGTALRQEYVGSVQGNNAGMSYHVGGGYTKIGDWLPLVGQSLPSAYGGLRVDQGPLSVDLSARYYVQHQETEFDPRVMQTGLSVFKTPFYDPETNQEQTFGVRVGYSPTRWWHHNLTAGFDRTLVDIPQSQPRFTTPDDSLLSIYNANLSKTSIAYNTTVTFPIHRGVDASVTAGFDHYAFRRDTYSASGTLNTEGGITVVPGEGFQSDTRHRYTNSGYFAQAQLNFRETVFLTGGLRAEENSNFGQDLGTPVSPRAGISIVRQLGPTTVKVRGSYGEAIRPPNPGQTAAQISPTLEVLANPNLAPERQRGWDAGVDLVFGPWGSLGITYYDQVVRDAIQYVTLVPNQQTQVSQYQNVGRLKNTGFEIEGTLKLGPAQVRAQYAIAHSRPTDLGSGYSGDLHIGDQVIGFPEHTGGGSVSLSPLSGTTITAGATYVGSWTYYDNIAEYSCFGGTVACPAEFLDSGSTRAFLIKYPGFVKANLSINQEIGHGLSGFIAVSNLTNNDAFELTNLVVVMGRVTMVGLHVRY